MTNAVPVIDLAPYFAGDGKAAVARQVAAACEEIGFLVIEGHGVAPAEIAEAFAVAYRFFELPAAEKERFRPADGVAPRGYHALGTKYLASTLGQDNPPDLREQFYIGPLVARPRGFAHIPGAAKLYAENIWPQAPAAYRDVSTRYYRRMELLGARPDAHLLAGSRARRNLLRPQHRQPFRDAADELLSGATRGPCRASLRAGEHSDFGSLTILALDDAPGGLQVKARGRLVAGCDRRARPVHCQYRRHDAALDQRSLALDPAPRRQPGARGRAGQSAHDIGFFLHPNYDAVIEALPGCAGPGRPARYAPVRAGDLMRAKMEARAA